MSEVKLTLWCDKEGHQLNYKVCQHYECDHLEGDVERGFVCRFENSKTRRAKKGQRIRELKKAKVKKSSSLLSGLTADGHPVGGYR